MGSLGLANDEGYNSGEKNKPGQGQAGGEEGRKEGCLCVSEAKEKKKT